MTAKFRLGSLVKTGEGDIGLVQAFTLEEGGYYYGLQFYPKINPNSDSSYAGVYLESELELVQAADTSNQLEAR